MPCVLALETSCDESAAAVVIRTEEGRPKVLASRIFSQIEEHARWGGVVPEIASRRHVEALPGLIERVLLDSGKSIDSLDAIAATVTPGLSGALLVASVTGRSLAALYGLPFLAIHHLEGHLASVHLADKSPHSPYLVLLVSGGHTELIKVGTYGEMKILGRTHDDAAGEAFDKVARMLGLGYPGGPAIQKIAQDGNPDRFNLPKGRISLPKGGFHPYDFSFSGLKTAMLRTVESLRINEDVMPIEDLAASFEAVVVDVLIERSFRCAVDNALEDLVLVGGVAANQRLRKRMLEKGNKSGIRLYIAPLNYCTDNAAMIGAAALNRLKGANNSSSLEIGVSARWPLEGAGDLYAEKPVF